MLNAQGNLLSAVKLNRFTKFTLNIELQKSVGLEIGPLNKPIVPKSLGKIYYLDHATQAELKLKYKSDPNTSIQDIVEVDFVQTTESLIEAVGNTRFDYVIASHVAEHVPDLVTWLQNLATLIGEDGVLRLAIPDKRFTFDLLRPMSDISHVLAAYLEKRKVSSPQSIIDFHLNYREVNQVDAWNGKISLSELRNSQAADYEHAIQYARESISGIYHDVHNWVVTQNSFAIIMQQLNQLGLSTLGLDWFIPVERNENEFFVSLRNMVPNLAFSSWEPMITYSNPPSS